jgi:hypothetical protein
MGVAGIGAGVAFAGEWKPHMESRSEAMIIYKCLMVVFLATVWFRIPCCLKVRAGSVRLVC